MFIKLESYMENVQQSNYTGKYPLVLNVKMELQALEQ